MYSPSGGVSASEKEAASPQHSAVLSSLTPQENRNPALTDMNQPSGGAHMASIMAFSSGGMSSPSMDMLPQHFTAPSWRMAQE